MNYLLTIHPLDNVAVCRESVAKGLVIQQLTLLDDIPAGHKVALKSIAEGDWVWKYGFSIGNATVRLPSGKRG